MIKLKLFLLAILLTFSQLSQAQGEVTGTVIDDQGIPLPGANVSVVGTNRGVITDFDGNYSITVAGDEALLFSFLGFNEAVVNVGGQSIINITLQPSAAALDEIVLTGYSRQSTRDITGSVSTVSSEALAATSPVSLEESLQGQASGVVVNTEGGPGGAAAIRIRGYGTINGNDPLFIIDGTPTAAGLNSINPNDIESIQILKDASSAAIYGNRAANGVVIITTKSGSRNKKAVISGNSFVGIDFIPQSSFPQMASPQQLADALWRAEINTTGNTPNHPQFGNGPNPVIPDYLWPQGTSAPVDESVYDYLTNRIVRSNPEGTDWFYEFFNPAIVQNYNISATGGGENFDHFLSFNALDQEGVAYETGFTRFTLRANSTFSLTPSLRIGQNLTVSYSDRVAVVGNQTASMASISSLYRIHPLIPVKDVGGNFAGANVGGLGAGANGVAYQDRNKDNHILNNRSLGNIYGELDVLKGLVFKTSLGFDLNSVHSTNFQPQALEGATPNFSNNLQEFTSLERVYTWFNTLNYELKLNDHSFNGLFGTEFNKRNLRQFGANRGGYLFNEPLNIRYLDLGTNNINNFGSGLQTAYWSMFGKVDYKYLDRYLISGTLRYDSSSLFTKENRSGTFPSMSIGWRASNEEFLQESTVFTDLMFKAGYGQIGNDGSISPSASSDIYAPNRDYYAYPTGPNSLAVGNGLVSRGNPNLGWEITTTVNAGFTARLFDLFNFNFEYYDATTEDMLLSVPADPTVFGNVNTITRNYGKMNNKGFDVSADYNHTTSGGFFYTIGANISQYKNEVVSLDPNNPNSFINGATFTTHIPNRTQGSYPLASFYGKKYLGIGEDGRMQFEDINGDGVVNNSDQTFIGNPHPDFTYGINFRADYRNFDMFLLIQGSHGNEIYNFMKYNTDFNVVPGARSLNYVTETGLPMVTTDAGIILNESAQSSYFLEDGSYARLKNIQLGYTLPEKVIEQIGVGLSSVRVYLQGRNLITITNYSGLDPEINLATYSGQSSNLTIGVDSGSFPTASSVMFGLDVSF
jgi:TonB-linked SusC/RagA family outer membrane protein